MEKKKTDLDLLKMKEEKRTKGWLGLGERVLLSCSVFKFNKRNKRQERNLMITNQHVYNLTAESKGLLGSTPPTLKRKIHITNIDALTLSRFGSEFVLHVPMEYDYRYSQFELRKEIVAVIIEQYQILEGKGLQINYKDDVMLEKYTTTKISKKKGERRQPTDGQIMTKEQFLQKSGEGGQSRRSGNERKTLYSSTKQEVSVEDFNMVKVLGRGAYGKVMLVQKNDDQEYYAMKSLRKEDMIEKEQVENVKSEKMVLQCINNPFMVHLQYCFQTSDKVFFVMSFMKGGELYTHLRKARRFTEPRTKFYAAQIFSALSHLHSQDILYRDLKPENVLMDSQGNICLTDFGLAKKIDKNLAETMCGTPEYMSPEIINGQPYGKSSDWWTLGVMIYEMLIGLTPFYNQSQQLMYQLIKEGQPRFPSQVGISEEGKDIIRQLLVKEADKRLGCKGCVDIQQHSWFKDIDWQALNAKQLPTPFIPPIQGDSWLNNFDDQFTKEDPINSFAPIQNMDQLDQYNQNEFKEF